jgi:hypothetical protein
VFNLLTCPPGQAENETCPKTGGPHQLFQRPDDNEATVAERLKVYDEKTKPLIEFYREQGILRAIDAEGELDQVTERLEKALGGSGSSGGKRKAAAVAKATPRARAAAKKASGRRSAAGKAPVKKAPAKRSAVKKAPVKKAVAKKSAAKKAPAKRSPGKKTASKKAAAKKGSRKGAKGRGKR